jgi:hypothetical protein
VAVMSVQYRNAVPATEQAVSGELVGYEVSRRNLTLRTEEGERHFVVQDGAPVHEGPRTIAVTDLTSASGCRAKVWYQGAQRKWIASEIRIACGAAVSDEGPSQRARPQ